MRVACTMMLVFAVACSPEETEDQVPVRDVTTDTGLSSTTTDERVEEQFQLTPPKVDVLWVIDNSCSMLEEQTALAGTFSVFMDYFLGSGLDYHIGSVSTDMNSNSASGKLQSSLGYRFIDTQTPDPVMVFQSMAILGTNGASIEQGRDAAYAAIEINPVGANDDFYREDASLHIVAISDEEDQSNQIGKSEFVDWMLTLKATQAVSFSSIVSPSPRCPTAATPGLNYIDVTDQVGGELASICDSSGWPDMLNRLGLLHATGTQSLVLSQTPVLGSIEVLLVDGTVTDPAIEGSDWTFDEDSNSVVFEQIMAGTNLDVVVSYVPVEL